MSTLADVSSELVARHESWVRRQAQRLARRLPANVERADLVQAGLIAVAYASLSFRCQEDEALDPSALRDSFERYACQRVRGAMLDELRRMDSLTRGDRGRIKLLQRTRERWVACHGAAPTLSRLAESTGVAVASIARLDQLATQLPTATEGTETAPADAQHPVTAHDEVEARVDTALVMRRLDSFVARLPERDRRVIEAYLGDGPGPVELAALLRVTPSRVSMLYRSLLNRMTVHFAMHRG